jgi:YHS domain-containing protein
VIPRILLFCSIFFIAHTSHSMEIVKKTNTKHKKTLSLEQQNHILEKLSRTKIVELKEHSNFKGYGKFYVFSSEKNYKQFLTLPRELREPIAYPSNNITGIIQQKSKWDWSFARYMGTIIKLKWIIPENENKKTFLPKILLRNDGWCYCA